MKNLFESVANSQKEKDVNSYLVENVDNYNNIPVPIIKQILLQKLKDYQKKYPKLKPVSLKFQYYQGETLASVNQFDLNIIHINLWKFIMQIYDQIVDYEEKIKFNYGEMRDEVTKQYREFVQNSITEFEDQYKVIGHSLSHIIDYEYNGFKENNHNNTWKEIFKKIVGVTPNLDYFVD